MLGCCGRSDYILHFSLALVTRFQIILCHDFIALFLYSFVRIMIGNLMMLWLSLDVCTVFAIATSATFYS